VTGQHPRLRSHVRRRKSGKIVTYYVYDRRPDGEPDIALGTNYEQALKQWREIHERKPRIAGTLDEAFDDWERERLPLYTNKHTRHGFTKGLRRLRPWVGHCRWDEVELPDLKAYLDKRSAKVQGNREIALLSIIWNWARLKGLTKLPWPAAGMERSGWKNPERPRKFAVTDELFAAVYAEGDQVLRDCMDVASATAMRLTDCVSVLLPRGDLLRLEASKTGKEADFEVRLSMVLPDLLERRRASKAAHLMLLSTATGRPVTLGMLRSRWDKARAAAALAHPTLSDQIRAMFLRDMRKYASDQPDTLAGAAELLQHSDPRLTERHYRTRVARIRPGR
jgi:hypothetical protein